MMVLTRERDNEPTIEEWFTRLDLQSFDTCSVIEVAWTLVASTFDFIPFRWIKAYSI